MLSFLESYFTNSRLTYLTDRYSSPGKAANTSEDTRVSNDLWSKYLAYRFIVTLDRSTV